MVALLMTLHKRLVETEGALEASLKVKQGESAPKLAHTYTAIEDVPLVTTFKDPPIGQASEAGPSGSAPIPEVTTEATTSEQTPNLSMQNMMKEIEALEMKMA